MQGFSEAHCLKIAEKSQNMNLTSKPVSSKQDRSREGDMRLYMCKTGIQGHSVVELLEETQVIQKLEGTDEGSIPEPVSKPVW